MYNGDFSGLSILKWNFAGLTRPVLIRRIRLDGDKVDL